MNNLLKFCAIALVMVAIAFTGSPAIADSVDASTINSLRQAAQKVIEDDSAKEQFGQSENGDRLLDQAKIKASQKLSKLAKEAEQRSENLPNSKKLFLNNLKAE